MNLSVMGLISSAAYPFATGQPGRIRGGRHRFFISPHVRGDDSSSP